MEHVYRGFPLTVWVEGARQLFPEAVVEINTEDAGEKGISQGDPVTVTSRHFEKVWTARLSNEQPRGTLHVTLPPSERIGNNPHPVSIRKKNV
jgi:anaerobic selenocysteine-containing dehydrogenase